MGLVNTTPTTVKVAETPLTSALIDKGTITSTWSKWFSAIGTWISKSQENKSGDFTYNGTSIGSFRINRTGNIVCINGSINAGDYSNIMVGGVPVYPIVDIPIMISNGTGKITTGGDLNITSSSTEKILISASYIANAPKEIK